MPLYAGTTPVASLVLVAIAPERITEEQLAPLSEPLRDLAHMIEAARRRGATAAPAATPPAPVRPAAERDRREAARAQSPVTSVAAAEALEAAAEPVGDETRDAERAVEVEGLMARLTEAEAAAERERERLRASEGEREQLAAQLREAAAREERAPSSRSGSSWRKRGPGRTRHVRATPISRCASRACGRSARRRRYP